MSNTTRTVKRQHLDEDRFGRRQPRPQARRQGTRSAIVRAAILEG